MTLQKALVNILDFNDSFTYNIAAEVYAFEKSVKVIPFHEIESFLLGSIRGSEGPQVIIYGPGPGNLQEYAHFFPLIKNVLQAPRTFHFGVCLGHQILANLLGYQVTRSSKPEHGQKCQIEVPEWSIFHESFRGQLISVQRYNSLGVFGTSLDSDQPSKELWYQNELFMLTGKNLLSYQFHPESVGTSFRRELFAPIEDFLYNNGDECANQSRRNLR